MRSISITTLIAAAGLTLLLSWKSACWSDEQIQPKRSRTAPKLEEARRQAELLHDTLHSTLHVIHADFYREDEKLPIPAASLGRVFQHVEKEHGVTLRWLAVDGEAMNVDHKARDDFERAAVSSIQSGQPAYESANGGVYRRAAAITLTGECLKCHIPNRKSTADRSAGLIVSMPIRVGD